MSEDEAFIRAIVDNPGDDTPRLVYADWLDDRDDPRGTYLRAEREAVEADDIGGLRALRLAAVNVARLDPVWLARVSRPPVGVCVESELFRGSGPATEEAINAIEAHLGVVFPPDYRAFLLNHDGGVVYYDPPESEPDAVADFALTPVRGLVEASEEIFTRGDESNRTSGLFPIGAGDVGRAGYLIGVGPVTRDRGKLYGRVFMCYSDARPWVRNGEFVEVEHWDRLEAESFAELFPSPGR